MQHPIIEMNTWYTLTTQTWDMSSANFAYNQTWKMDFAQRNMVDWQENAFDMLAREGF